MGSEAKPPASGGMEVWRKSVIGKGVWRQAPESSQALGDVSIF